MRVKNKVEPLGSDEDIEANTIRLKKLTKIFYAVIVLTALALIVLIYYILKKYYSLL